MSVRQLIKASLESIDFQDGRFFDALTQAVAAYRASVYVSGNKIHVDPSAMQKVIKKFANIKIKFKIDLESLNASIGIPMLNPNNAMEFFAYLENNEASNSRMFDNIKKLGEAKTSLHLGIDLAKSKMLGEFSDWPFEIEISLSLLHYLNDDEIAAVLLHEIGHLFAYVEYSAFTYTLNAVLTSVLNDFFATNDPKQRTTILQYFEETSKAKIEDKKALADDPKVDKGVVTTVIVKSTFDALRSMNGAVVYDRKSFEQMADNFATRHGAARALATLNMKLDRIFGARATHPWLVAFFTKTSELWISALFGLALGPGVAIACFVYCLFTADDPNEFDGIYDSPIERANNLRRQVIENLKCPSISNELRKKALDDIKKIDEVIANYNEYRTVAETIMDYLIARRSNAISQVKFQKELEEMASNRLFASAAKLTITKD